MRLCVQGRIGANAANEWNVNVLLFGFAGVEEICQSLTVDSMQVKSTWPVQGSFPGVNSSTYVREDDCHDMANALTAQLLGNDEANGMTQHSKDRGRSGTHHLYRHGHIRCTYTIVHRMSPMLTAVHTYSIVPFTEVKGCELTFTLHPHRDASGAHGEYRVRRGLAAAYVW